MFQLYRPYLFDANCVRINLKSHNIGQCYALLLGLLTSRTSNSTIRHF